MSADALKNEGNELLKNNDLEGAIEKYTEAITINPSNKVFFSNRSAAYAKKSEYQKAHDDAVKAIELEPTWPKGYSRKGAALVGLNRLEEAKIAYEESLKLDPNNAATKAEVESLKSKLSGPSGSQPMGNPFGGNPAEIFQKLATDPRTKEYMSDPSYMSMLQELSSNPANAMKHMADPRMQATLQVMFGINLGADADGNPTVNPTPENKANQPPPSEADPICEEKEEAKRAKAAGNDFYKKKDFENAIKNYKKAVELDPSEMIYVNNLATCYFEMAKSGKVDNYDDCREYAQKAVDVGRENRADYKNIAKALKRIAMCFEKEKKFDDAIKWYNKSLSEHREKETLATVQKLEKQAKEAKRVSYFDETKAQEAKDKGNELFKKGQFPDAIKAYEEGLKRTADGDSKLLSNRAGCYSKLMEFHRAQKDCEEALKYKPDFVKCWIRKGAVLEAQKQLDNALESYRKAIELDPNAKEAQDGMNRVSSLKYAARNDPEQVKARAMNDPEIQAIMGDPSMRMILEQMQQNPQAAMEHMKNPDIAQKIQKLVDCGLISVSSR
ncbi:unnamed protein product [Oikopleura dioica]|uniref:Stress-induced-phosphoprotein 1 n=1 Tax=Oikopleura dioica TaxID=34765 RepID=E4YJ50_OIKDI|nr:unnamed protein product [Oikopleura dioica]